MTRDEIIQAIAKEVFKEVNPFQKWDEQKPSVHWQFINGAKKIIGQIERIGCKIVKAEKENDRT